MWFAQSAAWLEVWAADGGGQQGPRDLGMWQSLGVSGSRCQEPRLCRWQPMPLSRAHCLPLLASVGASLIQVYPVDSTEPCLCTRPHAGHWDIDVRQIKKQKEVLTHLTVLSFTSFTWAFFLRP